MQKPLTRLAAVLMALVLAVTAALPATAATSDAPGWAAAAVQFNTQHQMIENETAWNPSDPAPRKSVVYALYHLDGGSAASGIAPEDMTLNHVTPYDYLFPAIWAKGNNIVSGTKTLADGRWYFSPEGTVDRQQMVTFLYAYARYEKRDLSGDEARMGSFHDGARTAGWAKPAMAWALKNGLISGTGGNMLSPAKRLSRAELAVFLHAYEKRYAAPVNTPTPEPDQTPAPEETPAPAPTPGLPTPPPASTPTPDPTGTPTPEATATPSPTPTGSPTPTPIGSPTPSPTPTASASPTPARSPRPTPIPSPTPTPEPIIPGTISGFDRTSWSGEDPYKVETCNSRRADGSNEYEIWFLSDGSPAWMEGVEFEIEDMTPPAYKKMFADMGYPSGDITLDNKVTPINYLPWGVHVETVTGPIVDGKYETGNANSRALLTIKGNFALRAIKITAKRDGKVLDVIYALCNGSDDKNSNNYLDCDLAFYKKVRERIEAQIWDDSMSNLNKLSALANYINSTTRYPNTKAVDKDLNPQFWKDWSVDGLFLFWGRAGDSLLNRCMDMQGGIVTCQAQSILQRAAVEDLGLPYLYDGKTGNIALGEGVWSGTGQYSSAPYNPWHESLIYKDANEKKYWLDAQGREDPESKYDYNSHILPLN